ncbi:mucosa-associated lymphoid tissue lymphoma translocation protein 1-like [Leucoraja erinacea]|uniref:mucosa-associated lymphoid tissue lymphoma translocation protein 1-like n=1 Tax=Leucoraja erinaceus TaxID=7782 RepID=UPI002457B50E|nr:mucosa-associated lymphoid tissue lymphoma translocation protein 1-like [Leucoraja erinacea]
MDYWNMPLNSLGELTLKRLSTYLDNCTVKGWRKLAEIVSTESRFKCSEKELEKCSLQVLDLDGSPSRLYLQLLAERRCPVNHLLSCLDKMGHTEAWQCVVSMATDSIQIVVQPKSQDVTAGDSVTLCCQAVGPPGLGYQWFRGKYEVTGGNLPELLFNPVDGADGDWYVCRVHCGSQYSFSQWVRLRVYSSPTAAGRFCRVNILVHPVSLSLKEGDTMLLPCSAVGNPPPQYQWFCNDQLLPDANKPNLEVMGVTTADRGMYYCRAFNLYHDVWSRAVSVEIGPNTSFNDAFIVETGEVSSPGPQMNVDHHATHLQATDKVALLIGNMNYCHHKQLKAPMVDVHELTNLLRQLDFKVVSLLDLTGLEMHTAVHEFLLLLDKGVYGLLYYAGHGYENYGNSFMVPIDAPYSYTSEHCLCVQNILQLMQEKQTGLNIFLLDMCRKRNMHDEIIPQMEALRVTANIVYGYATCPDAEAYEISQGELTNGIFMSFLKKRLLEDEKVTVLLDKVAEDMGRCELTKGRQALEIRSSLSERRSLTDSIKPPHRYDEFSARNLQWAKANVLPESKFVQFECGALIRLGFAAEFSNIMIIYASIVQTSQHITQCEARLTDFPEDLDVNLKHTNKGCPEETGSVLFSFNSFTFPEQCLYTRLSGLQKLRTALSFSICLQYLYKDMDEAIEEKKVVSIGKPLVSKLSLHGLEHQSGHLSVYGSLQSSSCKPAQMSGGIPGHTCTLPLKSDSWNGSEGSTGQPRAGSECPHRCHSSQGQPHHHSISPGASSQPGGAQEEMTAQFTSLWSRDCVGSSGTRRDGQYTDGELHSGEQPRHFHRY